ncbi:MAG: hypothetical protein ACRDL5_11040, partial [Solirubrobacteraceae bacterium]
MRIDWVHPTWRDLMIDRLAGDARLRRRFVSRCGLHGLLLALSVGGGALGERRLPLVVTDAEWDVLGDRIYELIPQLHSAELGALLTAIEIAVCELGPDGTGREARALARTALIRVAKPWHDRPAPISLELLDAWLSLSSRLSPPLPAPPLDATWAQLLPAAVPALDDSAELARFADWAALCEMLW